MTVSLSQRARDLAARTGAAPAITDQAGGTSR